MGGPEKLCLVTDRSVLTFSILIQSSCGQIDLGLRHTYLLGPNGGTLHKTKAPETNIVLIPEDVRKLMKCRARRQERGAQSAATRPGQMDAHQITESERETSLSTAGVTSRGPKPIPPVAMMMSTGFGPSLVHAGPWVIAIARTDGIEFVPSALRATRPETGRPDYADHEGEREEILRGHLAVLINIISLQFFFFRCVPPQAWSSLRWHQNSHLLRIHSTPKSTQPIICFQFNFETTGHPAGEECTGGLTSVKRHAFNVVTTRQPH